MNKALNFRLSSSRAPWHSARSSGKWKFISSL